ncbi:hypothetical protein [Phocaeicola salanitronis]|uniref:hypothetical protein n=1 Tax=Phocaeicola salanitronis TaxID=376805 RepID=UPI001180BC12|nr:hypothetical protein [Phocaeicola salanitronis]
MQQGIASLRKLPAACSEESQACESFLQRAARNRKPTKASCSVQREIASLRKLPATCSKESQAYESFLQRAARNRKPAKVSCSVQQGIASLRKLPAACSGKLQACENFLQSRHAGFAIRIINKRNRIFNPILSLRRITNPA